MMNRICKSASSTLAALAICGVAATTTSAAADSVLIGHSGVSEWGLGDFEGSLTYSYDAFFDLGTLVVELTNTSNPANGGYLTGFLFNIASDDPNATATLSATTDPDFLGITNGNGNPFGNPYDAGAGLAGGFQGGGNPPDGIAVGATESFTFDVNASDASSLSASSFILGGPYAYNFILRFRGFEDDGSDHVAATIIPLPAPLLLAAGGLPVVLIARRRHAAKR